MKKEDDGVTRLPNESSFYRNMMKRNVMAPDQTSRRSFTSVVSSRNLGMKFVNKPNLK